MDSASFVDSRAGRVYLDAVRSSFAFLKESATIDEAFVRSISLPGAGGVLLPVCRFHLEDDVLIGQMADGRRRHASAFPTRFEVTTEGTRRWLERAVLDVSDKMLFLVTDRFGRTCGHIGLANPSTEGALTIELDNVVRLDDSAAAGLMTEAAQALMEWARCTFWPEAVRLRVLADNARALQFYERLGFSEAARCPLKEVEVDGGVALEDCVGDEAPDNEFVVMQHPLYGETPTEMILTAGPSMSAMETSYAWDAAKTGWNRNWSGYLTRFEQKFAEYVGMEYALPTSSCTGALHLALAALGVGPGDEVIVPDATWVASATAVLYLGATPVFVDVALDSWCMDPDLVEDAITSRTRAIIPVHLYGHPARMDRIMEIGAARGIPVIEDAAPSIGSECLGAKTGSFGTFSAFSFQGAKMLVTGEGGMLLTNDASLFKTAEKLWDHGRSEHRQFWIDQLGFKYKMSNVQAAIGLGQIERVDEQVEAKRRIFGWYEQGLRGLKSLRLQNEAEWAYSNYWMSSAILDPQAGITRDEFRSALKDKGVDTRPVFPAISQYPIWPTKSDPKPNAYKIGEHGVNLPSGVCLTRAQVDRACEAIREVLGE